MAMTFTVKEDHSEFGLDAITPCDRHSLLQEDE